MGKMEENPLIPLVGGFAAAPACAFIANRIAEGAVTSPDPLLGALDFMGGVLANPFHLCGHPYAIIAGLLGAVAPLCGTMLWYAKHAGNRRVGEEQGSARWNTRRVMERFAKYKNPDPDFGKIVFSENCGMAYSRTEFCQNYDRNLNTLVLGGSGAGKTRFYVKPNVLNLTSDIFVTDPKGDLLADVGTTLEKDGYDIRCFNTFLPDKSLVYNPLEYVKTDLDILSFAKMFINMTQGTKASGSDPFWEKAETQLYIALIAFLRDWCPEDMQNIGGLLTLLSRCDVRENDETHQSELDLMFEQIRTGWIYQEMDEDENGNPAPLGADEICVEPPSGKSRGVKRAPSDYKRNSDGVRPAACIHKDGSRGLDPSEDFALENYLKFKAAAGKTLKSIIISCNVRLAPFTTAQVKGIVCGKDQMHLERFGDEFILDPVTNKPRLFPKADTAEGADRAAEAEGTAEADGTGEIAYEKRPAKNAIFCIFRDTDQQTLGFLHGIMVYQCINILCEKALRVYGGRLPRPVNFILDEYRSLNLPQDISAMISVIRSRNIAMSIILQSINQLGELYEEDTAKSIRGCCDTTLYLGGGKEDTCKFISEMCGDQTVVDKNTSASHGGSGGWSESQSKIKRPLIDPAEVAKLPKGKCIVIINGTDPYIDKKYPLEKHPHYSREDEQARFDIHEYMERREERARRDAQVQNDASRNVRRRNIERERRRGELRRVQRTVKPSDAEAAGAPGADEAAEGGER